jgi:hypothetical protein
MIEEFQIAKLDVQPGDTVVVKTSRPLSAETVRMVGDYVKAKLPLGAKVLVIDSTIELSVVSAVAA